MQAECPTAELGLDETLERKMESWVLEFQKEITIETKFTWVKNVDFCQLGSTI